VNAESRPTPGRGPLAAAAVLVAAAAAGLVLIDQGAIPGPSHGPADGGCVAKPGAAQQDVDPADSPESPWGHVPGQEVTVHFAT
jgi:hypothetical protein